MNFTNFANLILNYQRLFNSNKSYTILMYDYSKYKKKKDESVKRKQHNTSRYID